jgi:hypothetical protein
MSALIKPANGRLNYGRVQKRIRQQIQTGKFACLHGIGGLIMVARTIPFNKYIPNKEFPSLKPEEIDKPQTLAEQLKHAHEQQALEKAYPGRIPGSLLSRK